MKKLLLICCLLIPSLKLLAQQAHEVSGIVKDSTDNTVIGATVSLMSAKDTLKTVTNEDGIFIFKNVKVGQFIVSVKSLGYTNFNKRFLYNDATKRLVLDPIVLKASSSQIGEVKITGPSIVYKEDTVEYRASDYKVRENATVDELLKKMEGVEVGTDGSVVFQGQAVTKARLNGKDYSGGDVANAIQNLPADIIEKAQFVDDYGDQAARTGIKDGEPKKVLNLTTKANRSIGNSARINLGAGSDERLDNRLFGQRLNANQVITANIGLNNTVTGIAGAGGGSSGVSNVATGGGGRGNNGSGNQGGGNNTSAVGGAGSSGGTNSARRFSVGYRDKWKNKVDVNASVSYGFTDNTSSSDSETYTFLDQQNTIYSKRNGTSESDSKNAGINLDIEYEIDKMNYLRVQPNFTLSSSGSGSLYDNYQQTNKTRQSTVGGNTSDNKTPNIGGSLLYQHIFAKKGRNFSLNLSYTSSDQERLTEQGFNIFRYDINTTDLTAISDSLVNRLVTRKNLNNTFRASTTFSESLGTKSRIDFNGQVNRRAYDNSAYTQNADANGNLFRVDSLNNIYNYSFTESRLSLNYKFTVTKLNFSLGMTAIPTLLEGSKEHLNSRIRRPNFFLIPIARFEYQFSRQHRFSINYTGNAQEPTFDQIQPVRDESNVNNPIVGNPELSAAFNHIVSANYNNYIANSRFSYSVNVNYRKVDNAVISNVINYLNKDSINIYETNYMNMNGVYSYTGNYSISKSLADRRYALRLNGSVSKNHGISMSAQQQNVSNSWTFNQRFGAQINPKEWLEINPNVNFLYKKADFSLAQSTDTWNRNWALSADGKIYFQRTLVFNFSASKNYINGINATLTASPLIINSGIEKQFFKKKNGAIGIQAFDVLKQNSFVNLTTSDNGYTQTRSNALSRYFMINFRWAPSKWSGTPSRNGRQMMRRGDGSFF